MRVFWIIWCSMWALFWLLAGFLFFPFWIMVPASLLAILIPVGGGGSQPTVVIVQGQAPPGWYPDPSGAGQQRWWDGVRWL